MHEDRATVRDDTERLRRAVFVSAAFAGLLWAVKLLEALTGLDLKSFGVYPGEVRTLPGILFMPLVHGSFAHLFANTLPVLVLGSTLLYGYRRSAPIVIAAVYLGSGFGVWLFGRAGFHIGASGLTSGVLFFLFVVGVLRWDKRAIALTMVVMFLYGSMIWGIFPGDPSISHEAHLSGAIVGVCLAVLLRNHDPRPPRRQYSWETDAELEEPEQDESGYPYP